MIDDPVTLSSIFHDTEEVTRRARLAVREALLDHKRAGNPVAVWRDNKVVIVPPGEIDVDGGSTDTNVSPPEATPPRRSTSRSR